MSCLMIQMTPLSVIGKKVMQSILSSKCSHDEDNDKDEDQEEEEEEGGELSDIGESWGRYPPSQTQVGLGWWQNC